MPQLRPAVSSLAWPAGQDDSMLALAASLGFEGVEVLPVRLFGALAEAAPADITAWRDRAAQLGLAVPAMQGVLFGVAGVHMFRSAEERSRLAAALRDVARVAGGLRAGAAVFGAPALRDPGKLQSHLDFEMAVELLADVASAFEDEGTALTIEPVSPALGGRFVVTTAEAIDLVRAVDRPGIRLQLDTGNLLTQGGDAAVLAAAVPMTAHLHLSEPGLAPLGSLATDHERMAHALSEAGLEGWASVEMLSTPEPAAALAQAWDIVAGCYLGRQA